MKTVSQVRAEHRAKLKTNREAVAEKVKDFLERLPSLDQAKFPNRAKRIRGSLSKGIARFSGVACDACNTELLGIPPTTSNLKCPACGRRFALPTSVSLVDWDTRKKQEKEPENFKRYLERRRRDPEFDRACTEIEQETSDFDKAIQEAISEAETEEEQSAEDYQKGLNELQLRKRFGGKLK